MEKHVKYIFIITKVKLFLHKPFKAFDISGSNWFGER
jgi:hypothetical protein